MDALGLVPADGHLRDRTCGVATCVAHRSFAARDLRRRYGDDVRRVGALSPRPVAATRESTDAEARSLGDLSRHRWWVHTGRFAESSAGTVANKGWRTRVAFLWRMDSVAVVVRRRAFWVALGLCITLTERPSNSFIFICGLREPAPASRLVDCDARIKVLSSQQDWGRPSNMGVCDQTEVYAFLRTASEMRDQ